MNDWLQNAGSKILDIGGAFAKQKLDLKEGDTKAVNAASDFPWQKIALIGAAVVALALLFRFAVKR